MGGNYISLRVDQNPSSEGTDHRFRAILHHLLQLTFYSEENKQLSLGHQNLICQICFDEVPRVANCFKETNDINDMKDYLFDRSITALRMSSQKAALILFVARGLALIH